MVIDGGNFGYSLQSDNTRLDFWGKTAQFSDSSECFNYVYLKEN